LDFNLLERGVKVDKNTKLVMFILAATVVMVISQLTRNATLFAVTMMIIIYSWIFLGTLKNGKMPKVLGSVWFITMGVMIISLLAMLNIVKVPENITQSHVLGFPLPTAILFFVFWIFAGVVNTAAYSARFEKDILTKEWIDEFEKKTNTNLQIDNKEAS